MRPSSRRGKVTDGWSTSCAPAAVRVLRRRWPHQPVRTSLRLMRGTPQEVRSGQTVRLMAAIGGAPQTTNGESRAPLQLTGAAISGPPALVVPGSTRLRRLLRSVISRGLLIFVSRFVALAYSHRGPVLVRPDLGPTRRHSTQAEIDRSTTLFRTSTWTPYAPTKTQ